MTALEQYITTFFGEIPKADLKTIVSLFNHSTIKKGEYLLHPGHVCDKLSFVHEGLLRQFVATAEKDITQWISTTGYFSGDLSSYITEAKSELTIQALVDTEISYISKHDYKLLGELVPKWHEIEKGFIIKCFIMMEQRIYRHLSMTAEERYEYYFEHNKELFNQVPLQYIASMLGMSPETLSRIRKKASS
ncbi:cyclic nucleotide-binding protein [Fulvivirga maritima]|uniref:Crp/Fnr family transcriptional regulator n=1 Tax=Fulvivirga maritima TaxID=2904247 RepID=UPI001F40F927|nr:cyclic nucleotide-binding domain-containing protein [Fulvivirga maritima]UII28291.1 cyclic nucleotide-binding protein [Fulvivirga maritima]